MRKEYGLICIGSGGRMPKDVEEISMDFNLYQRTTIEEARELMVKVREKLVDKVNAHEKIRPFLREYPFTWSGADISIAFHKPHSDSYYLDGSVAFVCPARDGKIAYQGAELRKQKLVDIIGLDGNVERVGEVVEDEVFIPLLREPYEEALRIVKSSPGDGVTRVVPQTELRPSDREIISREIAKIKETHGFYDGKPR